MTGDDPEQAVPLLSVRCAVCRAALAKERRGAVGRLTFRPRRRPPGCTCRRVWAAGQGPGTVGPPVGEAPPPTSPPPAAPPV